MSGNGGDIITEAESLIKGGTMSRRVIINKDRVKLTNFVEIFCDHRNSCLNKKCQARPLTKKFYPEDVAFSEMHKCRGYYGTDALGTVRGATIKEIGVWK